MFLDPFAFDGSVFSATTILADENRDVSSLKEYRDVIAAQTACALRANLEARLARLQLGDPATLNQAGEAISLYRDFAFVALYEGDHESAGSWLSKALELTRMQGMPAEIRANMMALLGINALAGAKKTIASAASVPRAASFRLARMRAYSARGLTRSYSLVHGLS